MLLLLFLGKRSRRICNKIVLGSSARYDGDLPSDSSRAILRKRRTAAPRNDSSMQYNIQRKIRTAPRGCFSTRKNCEKQAVPGVHPPQWDKIFNNVSFLGGVSLSFVGPQCARRSTRTPRRALPGTNPVRITTCTLQFSQRTTWRDATPDNS